MRTTIDSAGRVVIPRDIRDAVGLRPGAEVDLELDDDGTISIAPAAMEVKIVRHGKLHVMVPKKPIAKKMSNADVNRVLRRIRDRKI